MIKRLTASTGNGVKEKKKKSMTKLNAYLISEDRDTYSPFFVDSRVINLCCECHLASEALVKGSTSPARWVINYGWRLEGIVRG